MADGESVSHSAPPAVRSYIRWAVMFVIEHVLWEVSVVVAIFR